MVWIYNNKLYESIPFDWEYEFTEDTEYVINPDNNHYYLVYHPKWDKCFWTSVPQISGNENRLKFYLIDIYDKNKFYYCEAKNLELVTPKRYTDEPEVFIAILKYLKIYKNFVEEIKDWNLIRLVDSFCLSGSILEQIFTSALFYIYGIKFWNKQHKRFVELIQQLKQ